MKGIFGHGRARELHPKSALDVINDAEYPLVATKWKGVSVLQRVRQLSQVQLMACGNFSLIDLGELSAGPFNWARWVEYAELNYRILRACLVAPTYEELFALIGKGPMVRNAEAAFKEIGALLLGLPRGPKRQELERERDMLRCTFDLLLPDDYVAPIIAYIVGAGKTDIDKVTREMLLTAAALAERGHDNPADHIDGLFTPFNRDDINRRAWEVLAEERDEHTRKRARL